MHTNKSLPALALGLALAAIADKEKKRVEKDQASKGDNATPPAAAPTHGEGEK
jgi:hypothetical protein